MAKNCEGWAALFEVDNVLRNQTVFRDEIGKIPLRRQGYSPVVNGPASAPPAWHKILGAVKGRRPSPYLGGTGAAIEV